MVPKLATALVSTTILLSSCAGDIRIADQNVLGATFVVCKTDIKWTGTQLNFEGLEGDLKTRTFSLGKLEYKPVQIQQVTHMAQTIQRFFDQMCRNTLLQSGQERASYIRTADAQAKEVFRIVQEMENINRAERDPDAAISKQQKVAANVPEPKPKP